MRLSTSFVSSVLNVRLTYSGELWRGNPRGMAKRVSKRAGTAQGTLFTRVSLSLFGLVDSLSSYLRRKTHLQVVRSLTAAAATNPLERPKDYTTRLSVLQQWIREYGGDALHLQLSYCLCSPTCCRSNHEHGDGRRDDWLATKDVAQFRENNHHTWGASTWAA